MRTARSRILLVVLILGVAGILRIYGITSDIHPDGTLKGEWHPDESGLVRHALEIYRPPYLDHRYWGYPSLHIYLLGFLDGVYYAAASLTRLFREDPVAFWESHKTEFFLIARMVSWTAAMATLVLLFRMGARVSSFRTGVLALLFFGAYQQHVEHAHYGTIDALFVLLCLLSVALCLRFLRTGKVRDALLAGAMVGLATAEKYNGFVLMAPFILAALLTRGEQGTRIAWKGMFLGGGLSLLIFFLVNFYFFLDPGRIIETLLVNVRNVAYAPDMHAGLREGMWINHLFLKDFGFRWVLFLSFVGAALFLFRRPRQGLVLLSFPVCFFLLMSSFHVCVPRYLLPITPIACLLAAHAVDVLVRLSPGVRRVQTPATLLIALLLLVPLGKETRAFLKVLREPDTRELATDWILEHIPHGASLVVDGHRQIAPSLPEDDYVVHNRTHRNLDQFDSLECLNRLGIEYYVVSDEMLNTFRLGKIPSDRVYRELESDPRVRLLAKFEGYNYNHTIYNHTIWVYQLPAPEDGKPVPKRPVGKDALPE